MQCKKQLWTAQFIRFMMPLYAPRFGHSNRPNLSRQPAVAQLSQFGKPTPILPVSRRSLLAASHLVEPVATKRLMVC
jgi:hypothetical protein